MDLVHSISLEELVMAVRRQSQGFSRGSSSFRGVTYHPTGALLTLQKISYSHPVGSLIPHT